jgi:hypothetical protein
MPIRRRTYDAPQQRRPCAYGGKCSPAQPIEDAAGWRQRCARTKYIRPGSADTSQRTLRPAILPSPCSGPRAQDPRIASAETSASHMAPHTPTDSRTCLALSQDFGSELGVRLGQRATSRNMTEGADAVCKADAQPSKPLMTLRVAQERIMFVRGPGASPEDRCREETSGVWAGRAFLGADSTAPTRTARLSSRLRAAPTAPETWTVRRMAEIQALRAPTQQLPVAYEPRGRWQSGEHGSSRSQGLVVDRLGHVP